MRISNLSLVHAWRAILLLLAFGFAAVGQAQTTYTNTATGKWSTTTSWTPNATLPVGGAYNATIQFSPSATDISANDLAGAFLLNRLSLTTAQAVVNNAASSNSLLFTNSGATLPLLTNASTGTLTLNSAVTLATNLTVGVAAGGNIVINGNLSGSGSLTSCGTGTLVLSGVNTYGGTTTISSGTVKLGGLVPGLWEGLVSSSSSTDSNDPIPQTSVQLTARWGASKTTGTGVYPAWTNNTTWGYSGYFYAATNGTYTFGKNFDDWGYLNLDGSVILNNNTWNTNLTATANLTVGWHTIDLRFGQGGGGVGGSQNGGFGIAYQTPGSSTWQQFADPGDASVLASSPANVLPSGLVNYYAFNGNANDWVGGADGTLIGGATVTNMGGKFGNGAVYLNGTNSSVTMGALPAFTSGNQARTIAGWVQQQTPYPSSRQASYFGFYTSGNTNPLNQFYFDNNSGVLFTEYYTDSSVVQTNDNNWHFYAASWDGNNSDNVNIYVDGTLKNTVTAPTNGVLNNFGIDIGDRHTFKGYVSSLQVYNVALTQAQVASLYNWNGSLGSLPATTALSIASGATLDQNGSSLQVAALAGAGVITNSSTNAVILIVGDTNSTTFSGSINGAVALTKINSGTLVLSGTSTYSGKTTVTDGTLSVGGTNAIGTGTLTLSGGNLDSTVANLVNAQNNAQTWNSDFAFLGSQSLNLGTGVVTMNANCTVTINANPLTVGGGISGSGFALTKAGAGKLVFSGTNHYSVNTTVNAGTLELVQASLASNSTVAISNGAVLQLDFATTNQVAALVLNGAAQPNGVYDSTTLGGYLSGTGHLKVVALSTIGIVGLWTGAGANNLFVNATNWSSSPAPSNSFDVAVFDGSGNNAKAAAISISGGVGGGTGGDGSSLALLSGQTSAVGFKNASPGSAWSLIQGNCITVASGAGPLTFNGAATNNLFQLVLRGDLSSATTHTIINSNAPGVKPITFDPNVYFKRIGSFHSTVGIDGPGDVIISGRILCTSPSDTTSVAKSGTGTLTLSGDNTDTNGVAPNGLPLRGVTLNAGTLNINNPGALGTNDTSNWGIFTINGGTMDNTSGLNITSKLPVPQAWNGDFTYAGTYGLNLSNGAVTLSANRQVTVNANTLTVGGVINGFGFALTKAGAGKLVLSSTNIYTANTIVSNGTLEIVNAALLANSTVAISTGAILQLDFATTNRVGRLILNGVTQSNGVYGNSTPGGYITGPGCLQVVADPDSSGIVDDGYRLWMCYDRLPNAYGVQQVRTNFTAFMLPGGSATYNAIGQELGNGLGGLEHQSVPQVCDLDRDGIVLAGARDDSSLIAAQPWAGQLDALGPEGYWILSTNISGHAVTVIASVGRVGVLYGTFDLLRRIQTGSSTVGLNVQEHPKLRLRLLNHWEGIKGGVPPALSGSSIWTWPADPLNSQRIRDYARANASIGINGVVLNDVSADSNYLIHKNLCRVAEIANILRPYGIKVFLSAKFSAPIDIGGLSTADPLDPGVIAFWNNKATEIYSLIPDFGGYLNKADSESSSGPMTYGRTEVDGANCLAAGLAPYGGIDIWRAFIYSSWGSGTAGDRFAMAYNVFKPLDGQFATNVIVQVKNGPIDFQPREPFHPLYGAMPNTPLMGELEILQEYTGEDQDLNYLGPMWQEYLESDTYANGAGSTVKKVIEGQLSPKITTGITGVANISDVRNWCGHPFAQANWYVFGRLCWNPDLTAQQIADEWVRMTFAPPDTNTENQIVQIMMGSREANVHYQTPLGLYMLVANSSHYLPNPAIRSNYHRVDTNGLGFDRTLTGPLLVTYSDAAACYSPGYQNVITNLATCPQNLLVWFFHVPWDYQLQSSNTMWNQLCLDYQSGVNWVGQTRTNWNALAGKIDPIRFQVVADKLVNQQTNAEYWRNGCLTYFKQYSNRPYPTNVTVVPTILPNQ